MTPYEKLRSLPGAEGSLKPGVTFEKLDAAAHAVTNLDRPGGPAGRKALFHLIAKTLNPAA